MFPGELESSIAAALKTEQILVDPIVKVTVVEYHSRPISVMGAVKKPVTFQGDRRGDSAGCAGSRRRTDQRRRHRNSADPRPSHGRAHSREAADEGRRSGGELRRCTAARRFACRRPARFSWWATCTSRARSRCATPATTPCCRMVALSEGLLPYRRQGRLRLPSRRQRREAARFRSSSKKSCSANPPT